MDIFTIGHSNYSMERFLHMLRYFNINCVVDIRGTPYSKYNVQFDKESLTTTGVCFNSKVLTFSETHESCKIDVKIIYKYL